MTEEKKLRRRWQQIIFQALSGRRIFRKRSAATIELEEELSLPYPPLGQWWGAGRGTAPIGHGVAAALSAGKGTGHATEESRVELGPPIHSCLCYSPK